MSLSAYISTTLIMIDTKVTVANVTQSKNEKGRYLSSHLKGKRNKPVTLCFLAIT